MFEAIIFTAMGAGAVIVVAVLLRQFSRFGKLSTSFHLALSHTLLMGLFLAISPLYMFVTWGSPFADVYLPFTFVPGIHIYSPIHTYITEPFFEWRTTTTSSYWGALLCVIAIPGVLGIGIGGVQWWLLGKLWERS
jgi:hypothetical protein